jgi:hypothetical protein
MTVHTIELNAECERRLGVFVAEYNARTQSSLTLDAWLQLHVREMAIGRDLAARSLHSRRNRSVRRKRT